MAAPPSAPESLPAHLGPFKIVRTLAKGGMSEVYIGQKEGPFEGPDRVVLKVLRVPRDVAHEAAKVRELLGRLIEEGRLTQRLTHPAIARSFGAMRDPDQDLYFLVQEFVEGVTLGDLMDFYAENELVIPYGVILRLIIPVLQALHYAWHDAVREDGRPLRVVHRDIKPDNVMLSYKGEVRLVDFGVARSTSLTRQVTVGDVVVGTRHYMAPEQVFTPDQVGHRSDLFSVGLILYELCTLKPVFPRTRAVSEFANALARFNFNDHAGLLDEKRYPGIRAVLAKVLQPEPKDRYSSAADMARELQALEVHAPQNPTMQEFATQLREEISEAEGAQTMLGPEEQAQVQQARQSSPAPALSPTAPGEYRQTRAGKVEQVPRPATTAPGSTGPTVERWDAPARKTGPQPRPGTDVRGQEARAREGLAREGQARDGQGRSAGHSGGQPSDPYESLLSPPPPPPPGPPARATGGGLPPMAPDPGARSTGGSGVFTAQRVNPPQQVSPTNAPAPARPAPAQSGSAPAAQSPGVPQQAAASSGARPAAAGGVGRPQLLPILIGGALALVVAVVVFVFLF